MVASPSLEDLHYYRDRAEHCRQAAAQATDPCARLAHLQLVKFYETRMASALESAALGKRRGTTGKG